MATVHRGPWATAAPWGEHPQEEVCIERFGLAIDPTKAERYTSASERQLGDGRGGAQMASSNEPEWPLRTRSQMLEPALGP